MYVYLFIALLSAALAGGGMFKVQSWRHAAMEKQRIEAEQEAKRMLEKRIDVAAVGHEKDKTKERVRLQPIQKEIAHALTTDFYAPNAPACLNDIGVQQLNAAITGPADPPGIAPGAVQGLKPRNWWQPRRDPPVVD